VEKYEKKPNARVMVTIWLVEVMKQHMAYVTSVPELTGQFRLLTNMLESRIQSYSKVSSLAGRLDLMMAQVTNNSNHNNSNNNKNGAAVPQAIQFI